VNPDSSVAAVADSVTFLERAESLLGVGGLPPYVQAAIIAALSLIVAQILVVVLTRWVGSLTRRTKTTFDDSLLVMLRHPIFVTVLFAGLAISTLRLELPESLTRTTVRALESIAILVWMRFGFWASQLIIEALGRRRDITLVEDRTVPLFSNLLKVLVLGLASYSILQVWHIDAGAWLASAGILGLAVGFAAKDTLANLFSGVFILADTPYAMGDFIVLDTGERGRVTGIGLRSTRILTRDDIEIVIPNAVIANAKIMNESGGPPEKERVRVAIGVAYGSDLDQVCAVLEKVARESDHVCAFPEPRVRLRTFGISSVDFELLCWIDEPVLRGLVLHEMNMLVYKAFRDAGIEIPYPKRDVYVKALPASPESD
jgi:small-conductance mechanosensitive channel